MSRTSVLVTPSGDLGQPLRDEQLREIVAAAIVSLNWDIFYSRRSMLLNRLCSLNSFHLLVAAAMAALWPAGLQAAEHAARPTRPNILLVFTDDHAYQAIGAYGSRINSTPNIDRLAREGVRFDRCYVSNSICGPCRATVLTGKYSHRNGYYVNDKAPFDGAQQTFPKLLREVGYQTALFGKWHLGSQPTGFDYWDILIDQGPYYNPPMICNGEPVQRTGYTTRIITDLVLAWLSKQRDTDKPFMLMYQHKAPHRSWEPAPEYMHLFDNVVIPEPPTLFEDYSTRGLAIRQQDMTIAETMSDQDLKLVPPENLTPEQLVAWNANYGPKNQQFRQARLAGDDLTRWKYQRFIKDYLRCVAAVDDQLGRLLDYLDESGLARNTMVIYCSDQGFYLGEHGWFDKRWMFEESLRTPCIVRWPGVVQPGEFNDDIVSPLDFASTFLDVAGAEIPADLQGRSLVPVLKGNTPDDWRKSFYYHYYEFPGWHYVRRHYGVTDGRFKLMYFYEPDVDQWALYDLHNDRNELQNLIENPAYTAVRQRLKGELVRIRRELEVPSEDPPSSIIADLPPRTRMPDPAD
jgi:arylsulfatase A-like enzyme